MDIPLLLITLGLYLLATTGFLGHLLLARESLRRAGVWLLASAFAVDTLAILARGIERHMIPVTTFHETASALAWLMVGVYLFVQARYPLVVLGAFISPLAFVFTLSAYVTYSGAQNFSGRLHSAWLPAHIAPTFLGYAILAVAFCVSLVYLLQEKQLKRKRRSGLLLRLPSLEALDQLNHRFVTLGFSLFTVGIITGAFLAKAAWGEFWSWEPIQILSGITWTVYALLLHFRTVGWRGRKAATLTIVGFAALVLSFFSVGLLFPGKHGVHFG